MRTEILWSGAITVPAAMPLPGSPDPIAPRVFQRDDYRPHFDPESGLIRDGDTTYLIALVEPHAYDGSLVAPIALSLLVFNLVEDDTPIHESSTTIHGPGPIAVGAPGLTPGQSYQFILRVEYPDPAEDGSLNSDDQ